MNDIYLYDIVKLKRSYLYGIDFDSEIKEDYPKDTEGIVLEIDDKVFLLELDNNKFEMPILSVYKDDVILVMKHQENEK